MVGFLESSQRGVERHILKIRDDEQNIAGSDPSQEAPISAQTGSNGT